MLKDLKAKAIDTINDPAFKTTSMHTFLSAVRFYKRVDKETKQRIKKALIDCMDHVVEFDSSKWDDYVLEPYKVFSIDTSLFEQRHQKGLLKNLDKVKKRLDSGLPMPNWQWYQYEEAFLAIKHHWIGLLAYDMLKALKQI